MGARIRSNLLLILSLVMYLGALWGVIYVTDGLILRYDKAEYFQRNPPARLQFNPELLGSLPQLILGEDALSTDSAAIGRVAAATEQLKAYMQSLVEGPGAIDEITLFDNSQRVVASASNPRKVWRHRRWENTVILNFRHAFTGTVQIPAHPEWGPVGKYRISYTNPRNDAEVAAITARRRPLILGLSGVLTLLFAGLFYFILVPIRNVTAALNLRDNAVPDLVRRARTPLEAAYNRMATDALLMRLDERIRSLPERGENYERDEARQQLCAALADLFGYEAVWVVDRAPNGEWSLRGGWPAPSGGGAGLDSLPRAAIEAQLKARKDSAHPAVIEIDLTEGPFAGRRAMAIPLQPLEFDNPEVILVAVASELRKGGQTASAARTLFLRVAEEAGRSFVERQGRRRRLAQERSKANINIARHLGHDLTNIIATSKLDLMAVQNFLRAARDGQGPPEPRQQIFSEALEALLRNTRFLQEIVNLYRSFGYVQDPQYEWIDVNRLVVEMAELFSYATSANVRIETQLDPSGPRAVLEPRLIRFCLFNLMTNSVEAINVKNKQMGLASVEGAPPEHIYLSTRLSADGQRLYLSVRDTGAGIRGRDGALLPESRLRDILYLGITTKDEAGSEGLGLDWVRTIVEEFHQGRVEPRNPNGGGAEFTLEIPIESPERSTEKSPQGRAL